MSFNSDILSGKPLLRIGIALLILALFFAISFVKGCQHGRKTKKCPEIISGTIQIHDTIDHYIYDIWPWYIEGRDTVIYDTVPMIVDTTFILRDYFAKHVYNRKWENDTLIVNLKDTISRNEFAGNLLKYKIKTPFTTINNTIDNSVTFNKYLYFGLDLPVKNINYLELEGLFAFRKGYIGVGWEPQIKSVNVKIGGAILKFK